MSNHLIILLNFDDVIVLNRPGQFGGYDVIAPNPPPELLPPLFHASATQALVEALAEHGARVVITTSWSRLMTREGFERLFKMTGQELRNESLNDAWEASQDRGETRAQAIDRWLAAHHRGESYVILDNELSGTGLRRSVHEKQGRLVLCKKDVGPHLGHLAPIRAALSREARIGAS